MKRVAELDIDLNVEERNLLSVAYKNVIGARRASWRIVSSIENKEEAKGNKESVLRLERYRQKIENELKNICHDVLQLLDKHLIPVVSKLSSSDKQKQEEIAAAQVFYHKMKGDYYRYLAEFTVGDERKEAANHSQSSYEVATEVSRKLKPTDPIRLGLALNHSVFHYEIMSSPKEACKLAKEAFDEAITNLDDLPEEKYKDSTLIMQLLRDNLTLWTSGDEEELRAEDISDEDK